MIIVRIVLSGKYFAAYFRVRVRIFKKPEGVVSGVAMCNYLPGHSYDVDSPLAEYLVLEGFAQVEMRQTRRSMRIRLTDRRKLVH